MQRPNRRQWPRHEKKAQVQFTASLRDGYVVSWVSNFSRGGICLTHPSPLEKGRNVLIHLTMDLAGLSRDVRAKVKWCVPARAGGYAIGLEYEQPQHWTRYE